MNEHEQRDMGAQRGGARSRPFASTLPPLPVAAWPSSDQLSPLYFSVDCSANDEPPVFLERGGAAVVAITLPSGTVLRGEVYDGDLRHFARNLVLTRFEQTGWRRFWGEGSKIEIAEDAVPFWVMPEPNSARLTPEPFRLHGQEDEHDALNCLRVGTNASRIKVVSRAHDGLLCVQNIPLLLGQNHSAEFELIPWGNPSYPQFMTIQPPSLPSTFMRFLEMGLSNPAKPLGEMLLRHAVDLDATVPDYGNVVASCMYALRYGGFDDISRCLSLVNNRASEWADYPDFGCLQAALVLSHNKAGWALSRNGGYSEFSTQNAVRYLTRLAGGVPAWSSLLTEVSKAMNSVVDRDTPAGDEARRWMQRFYGWEKLIYPAGVGVNYVGTDVSEIQDELPVGMERHRRVAVSEKMLEEVGAPFSLNRWGIDTRQAPIRHQSRRQHRSPAPLPTQSFLLPSIMLALTISIMVLIVYIGVYSQSQSTERRLDSLHLELERLRQRVEEILLKSGKDNQNLKGGGRIFEDASRVAVADDIIVHSVWGVDGLNRVARFLFVHAINYSWEFRDDARVRKGSSAFDLDHFASYVRRVLGSEISIAGSSYNLALIEDIVAFGLSSEEGPLDAENERAERRGRRLLHSLRREFGHNRPMFILNFGQRKQDPASKDRERQRAVTFALTVSKQENVHLSQALSSALAKVPELPQRPDYHQFQLVASN